MKKSTFQIIIVFLFVYWFLVGLVFSAEINLTFDYWMYQESLFDKLLFKKRNLRTMTSGLYINFRYFEAATLILLSMIKLKRVFAKYLLILLGIIFLGINYYIEMVYLHLPLSFTLFVIGYVLSAVTIWFRLFYVEEE